MSTSTRRNPLTEIPRRAARWSAIHPWRAILGWVAFVPSPSAWRSRSRPRRPRTPTTGSGSPAAPTRWCTRPGSTTPTPRGPDQPARDGCARLGWPRAGRRRRRGRMRELDGVDEVAEPSGARTGRRYLVSIQLARDQDDVAALQDVTATRAGGLPGPRRSARPATSASTRRSTTGSPTTCRRPRAQPPGDADPDAARVRCADRRRHPGAARRHQRGRHGRHPRSALAPDPRRAHRHQHDRADRHGRRRRLLALLPQAGARGARQGRTPPWTPSRSPPRPPVTRSWCPAAR